MIYKGIIIQYLYDEDKNFHFIDGITEYKINAESKEIALHKMFNHYYSELWFSGDNSGDTSLKEFYAIDNINNKIKELEEHQCQFDYFLDVVEEDIKTQYFEL